MAGGREPAEDGDPSGRDPGGRGPGGRGPSGRGPSGRGPRKVPPTDAADAAARAGEVTDAVNDTAASGVPAEAGEPSLVARETRARADGLAGASERAAGQRGETEAPVTGGRIDAAAATEGRETGARGAYAGGGPVTSVGAPQGNAPGEAPLDEDTPDGRSAGVLESVGGREGGNARGGELYDAAETGRSIADTAAAASRGGSGGEGTRAADDGPVVLSDLDPDAGS